MYGKKESSIDYGGLIFAALVLLVLYNVQKWTGVPVLDWLESACDWTFEVILWLLAKIFTFISSLLR